MLVESTTINGKKTILEEKAFFLFGGRQMDKEGRNVQRDILNICGFAKCTRKDNETQKEDPGEEFREAGVDYQEPRPAPPLLRG